MKKLLITALATFSLHSFAQSYMIMDNGITLTIDQDAYVYDFGHYAFPQKVTLKGGKWFVEENSILATIDENGFLYRKYELMPEKILGKGINYFLSSEGELYTIDSKGAVHIIKDERLKRATNFGGNYFVLQSEEEAISELVTINREGRHEIALIENFHAKNVVAFGGTYFMTNRGVVHTISQDGQVRSQSHMRVGLIQRRGGNYFTDSMGTLFTVSADGDLTAPAVPVGFMTQNMTKLGSQYFLSLAGKLYVVDAEGRLVERTMRDHDFKHVRVLSL
jgi:hypothetical protein